TAIYTGDGYELVYTISNLQVGNNKNVGMEIVNENQMLFTNLSGDENLNLNIALLNADGIQNFSAVDIPLTIDSEYLIVPDINNFADGTLTIHVDNGMNGTVDDVLTFDNQLPSTLYLSSNGFELSNEGGSKEFMIMNAGSGQLNWSIQEKPEWVEINTPMNGIGNANVSF